jgi:hypothetical protein
LARPLYLCAASSPHIVDIELVEKGLHDQPSELSTLLQQKIDSTEVPKYDAVVLAYGLCGKATVGLQAKGIPLVMPRAHDCITFFLGSRTRYQKEFEQCPGTYWYAQDYVERSDGSSSTLALGAQDTALRETYDDFVAKYGEDNADYLMEVMGAWQSHYERAVFVDLGLDNSSAVEERARTEALNRGWAFERTDGDIVIFRRLLEGDWEDDFLVLQPGQRIEMAFNDDVISAADTP